VASFRDTEVAFLFVTSYYERLNGLSGFREIWYRSYLRKVEKSGSVVKIDAVQSKLKSEQLPQYTSRKT
jgi:hypothetical protein